ncbi:MAG: MarR family winged helix-turn-helix transcriptional regulator [Rhodoferax sp.]
MVEPSEYSTRVLRHFRQTFNAVKTHFQQVEKKAGIGGSQVWALSVIQNAPGIGVNDLATTMDIHQTTASNLVKVLLGLELVKVEKEGPDRRAVQLYILPAGKVLLKRAPGPLTGVLPSAISQLDLPTLKRLDRDLTRLLNLLSTNEKAARTPLADI